MELLKGDAAMGDWGVIGVAGMLWGSWLGVGSALEVAEERTDRSIDMDVNNAAIAVIPIKQGAAIKIFFDERRCCRENLLCIVQ